MDPRPLLLFADDDPVLRLALCRYLRGVGYELIEAADGEAAAAVLAAQVAALQLVVFDIDMPGVDGIELARRAQAARPELPVILITGHLDNRDAAQALLARVPVLVKPFPLAELAAAIRQGSGGAAELIWARQSGAAAGCFGDWCSRPAGSKLLP